MKETRINSNYVSHIQITPAVNSGFVWRDKVEKRGLFGRDKSLKEGYYNRLGNSIDVENWGYITIIDNTVWYQPFLEVFCGETLVYSAHYETTEEIRELCQREFPYINVILS